MSRRRALVPLVAFILTASPPAALAGSRAYFPVSPGNTWTLADPQSSATSTINVRRVARGLVLTGFPGAGALRVRQAGRAVQAWDPRDRRWEQFLRLGASAGTRYRVDLSSAPLWRGLSVTVASRRDVVHDSADSEFRNCVTLSFRYAKPPADAGLERMSFAPGVGPVLVAEQTIAGPREKLLERYRLRRGA